MGMCNLVASLMTCPESQTKLPHLHLPAVWRKKKCSEEHNTWTQSALCFSSEKQLLKSIGREGRFYSMSVQYEVCDSVRWTDDLFYSFPLLPRNVEVLCVRVSARGFRKRNHIGKPSSSVIHVYIGAVVAHLLGAELGSQTQFKSCCKVNAKKSQLVVGGMLVYSWLLLTSEALIPPPSILPVQEVQI